MSTQDICITSSQYFISNVLKGYRKKLQYTKCKCWPFKNIYEKCPYNFNIHNIWKYNLPHAKTNMICHNPILYMILHGFYMSNMLHFSSKDEGCWPGGLLTVSTRVELLTPGIIQCWWWSHNNTDLKKMSCCYTYLSQKCTNDPRT